jgi:flavin reductase (DIM6/NTAB) family NADH-FMN oxidoreductase RutF
VKQHQPSLADDAPGALRGAFLEAMSHTAASVSIVTTDGAAGRAGVTVSATTSVSADTPAPSLLVCINRLSSACPAILSNGVFCVNMLRDDQAYISDTFAGRIKTPDGDKFSCTEWAVLRTGAPRVVDPLVAFDCRLTHCELFGTHHVMFGEVEDIFIAQQGLPLIYANRAYGTPSRLEPPALGPRKRISTF